MKLGECHLQPFSNAMKEKSCPKLRISQNFSCFFSLDTVEKAKFSIFHQEILKIENFQTVKMAINSSYKLILLVLLKKSNQMGEMDGIGYNHPASTLLKRFGNFLPKLFSSPLNCCIHKKKPSMERTID